MTEQRLSAALRESMDEVLEKMFFIRSLGEPPDAMEGPEYMAQLTFDGDPPGWLTLLVTAPAARSVAADFLGEEEPALSEQQIGEVVCELANMICGSVLSRVESVTAFRLATPRLAKPPEDGGPHKVEIPSTATTHAADIGAGAITVIFNAESTAC